MFTRDVKNGTSQSITASRLLPCEDNAHVVQPLGLAAKWSFLLRPLSAPPPPPPWQLTSVVRRIATAACYGRQCHPKITGLHGDLCTGFPYPPCKAAPPLRLQTTELYLPEQSVGWYAPDQDLEPPGSLQGSSPLTGLLDLGWVLFS